MYDADKYFMRGDTKRSYSFVTMPHNQPQDAMGVMLTRVTNDNRMISETDHTDKPLYKSLIDAGVPPSQIIRTYAGKTVPEP